MRGVVDEMHVRSGNASTLCEMWVSCRVVDRRRLPAVARDESEIPNKHEIWFYLGLNEERWRLCYAVFTAKQHGADPIISTSDVSK